uniref:Leucine-rich repeat-containing N-terminal plant-type domain-containing protein n=2 Tax=Oryza TaxID=4527 RepID=A0A0E0NJ55_ORYRU
MAYGRAHLSTLADNWLSSELPKSFGRLTELSIVTLYNNSLEGPLPKLLFKLKLEPDALTNNRFSDVIPVVLAWSRCMVRLQLSGKRLAGTIPAELGKQTELKILELNNFSGDIPLTDAVPPWLDDLWLLGDLDLSSNVLTGGIPVELSDCSGLLKLSISGFGIRSILPEIAKLASLNILNLQKNGFTGVIPSELQRCNRLYELRLLENSLEGPIPPELGWYWTSLGISVLSSARRPNDSGNSLERRLCNLQQCSLLLAGNSFQGLGLANTT